MNETTPKKPKNFIQFVGHSCVWVALDGQHFLIDANFSNRIVGLKRHSKLGIDLQNLPDVAALLVTHAHYDHLDLFSYKYFSQKKTILSPPGLGHLIHRFLHNPIVELETDKTFEVEGIKITAVPTKHISFRISGLRYTRCTGYVLQGAGFTIYHPGDTCYGDHFREIGQKFKIDVALLPIGAYRPRWFMKNRHMSPDDAVQAFKDLGAKTMIPIHWGSFRLAFDTIDEPLQLLKQNFQVVADSSFLKVLQPGESLIL